MNKTELINKVAEETGFTQKDTKKVLDAMTQAIKEELGKGEDIIIPGFGVFKVSERPARKARNFQTGKMMEVSASKYVKFKVGKTLKEAVK